MYKFYIITGLSGAGKTFAIKSFEDLNFYCIDNIPPALISNFVELLSHSEKKIENVALVIDIRGGEFFDDLFNALSFLDSKKYSYKIIFLEASNTVLLRRFKETKRKHPLSPEGGVIEGIELERKRTEKLRKRADLVIDTSNMTPWKLKETITSIVSGNTDEQNFLINIISFGYKFGLPPESDFIFDVRFLPNPFYEESMSDLSGENETIYEYIMRSEDAHTFLFKVVDLITFLIPKNIKEGKNELTISIGCTGGQHRSVVIGIELSRTLSQKGYKTKLIHRDIDKK